MSTQQHVPHGWAALEGQTPFLEFLPACPQHKNPSGTLTDWAKPLTPSRKDWCLTGS